MIIIAAAELLKAYGVQASPFNLSMNKGVIECGEYRITGSLSKPKHESDSVELGGRTFYFWAV